MSLIQRSGTLVDRVLTQLVIWFSTPPSRLETGLWGIRGIETLTPARRNTWYPGVKERTSSESKLALDAGWESLGDT